MIILIFYIGPERLRVVFVKQLLGCEAVRFQQVFHHLKFHLELSSIFFNCIQLDITKVDKLGDG